MNPKSKLMIKLITVLCLLYLPVSVEATKNYDIVSTSTQYILPFLLLFLLFTVWRKPDNTFTRLKASYLSVLFIGLLVMIFHTTHP